MHRQWLRISCIFIMLAVMAFSSYHLFLVDQQRRLTRAAGEAYDGLAWSLTLSLADLRAAQQAYVATGQNPDVWIEHADRLLRHIADGLDDLARRSLTRPGGEAVESAGTAIERLRRVDDLAREHTTEGRPLMASDLVFTDGVDLARRAAGHLERARSVEREARSGQGRDQRGAERMLVAMSTGVMLVVVLLLFPVSADRRRPPDRSGVGAPAAAMGSGDDPLQTGLAEAPIQRATAPLDLEVNVNPVFRSSRDGDGSNGSTTATESVSPGPAHPDLRLTAEICTTLAQLPDHSGLDQILSEARQLLNATGLIVWVRDSTGTALRPAAGHGYTTRQLVSLGRVGCNGDNATAAAYRSGQVQVVERLGDSAGALAVPLLSASSGLTAGNEPPCVGVLSVEVRHGWETSEAVQATASILAAQMATFVSADPAHRVSDGATHPGDTPTHAVG